MEGAVTLWMPDSWTLEKVRHPYQRTYRDDKQARWETDDDYCNAYAMGFYFLIFLGLVVIYTEFLPYLDTSNKIVSVQ